MEITLKTTSMIRPAEELPARRLWNSDLDLVMPAIHISTVYSYKPDGSSNFFDIGVLKDSLSKVLVHFYPMAGRLGKDETGRIEIVCNSEGVLLVEAESCSAMADLCDFATSSELGKLLPNIDSSQDISSYPLIAFQVTRFKCGGVTLGASVHHTLVDGISVFHFINSWSELARGVPLTITPFIDRSILRPRDPPAVKFRHTEYSQTPRMNNINSDTKETPRTKSAVVFQLTTTLLNALKTQANENNLTASTTTTTTRRYNSFSVLAAHIWRCVTKARGLPDDQAIGLYIPTNGRSRFCPPIPSGYLGNVIFSTDITALSRDLQEETLTRTVERIEESVKRRDDEYLRSALDYLNTVEDCLTTIMCTPETYGCPNLSIVSWLKMPAYEADFGWGKPTLMPPIYVPHDGIFFMLPNSKDDNSVTLIAYLESSDHMERFQELLFQF